VIKTREKSPFTCYREGYLDGYNGEAVRMPESKEYMQGFREGGEDDTAGLNCKFPQE